MVIFVHCFIIYEYNSFCWTFSNLAGYETNILKNYVISSNFPQVRHSNIELLENLKDLPSELLISLPSSIKLDVYDSRYNLFDNTKKMHLKTLFSNDESPIYVAVPADDK